MKVIGVLHHSNFGGCEKLAKEFAIYTESGILLLQTNLEVKDREICSSSEDFYHFPLKRKNRIINFLKTFHRSKSLADTYDNYILWHGRYRLIETMVLIRFWVKKNHVIIHIGTNIESIKFIEQLTYILMFFASKRINLVFPSLFVKESAKRIWAFRYLKSEVISNAVSKPNLAENPKRARGIVMVSRFDDSKRQDLVLNGFAQVADKLNCDLYLVGNGPNLEAIKNEVAFLQIENRVHFLPENSNPFREFSKNDLFIFAHDEREGFGLVAYEAIIAGMRLIASNTPAMFELGLAGQYLFENNILKVAQRMEEVFPENSCSLEYFESLRLIIEESANIQSMIRSYWMLLIGETIDYSYSGLFAHFIRADYIFAILRFNL